MYYLRGLRFDKTGKKKLAVTFSSKGWSGGATNKLAETLSTCGFEVVQDLQVQYVPSDNDLSQCYDLGR